jgi:hypothetical protein
MTSRPSSATSTTPDKQQELNQIRGWSDALTNDLNEGIAQAFLLEQQLEHQTKTLLQLLKQDWQPIVESDRHQVKLITDALKQWGDLETFIESLSYHVEVIQTCLSLVRKQRQALPPPPLPPTETSSE